MQLFTPINAFILVGSFYSFAQLSMLLKWVPSSQRRTIIGWAALRKLRCTDADVFWCAKRTVAGLPASICFCSLGQFAGVLTFWALFRVDAMYSDWAARRFIPPLNLFSDLRTQTVAKIKWFLIKWLKIKWLFSTKYRSKNVLFEKQITIKIHSKSYLKSFFCAVAGGKCW